MAVTGEYKMVCTAYGAVPHTVNLMCTQRIKKLLIAKGFLQLVIIGHYPVFHVAGLSKLEKRFCR